MVRIWLTVIIRRIAIIGLLLTLSLGIGLVWRCYAAEGNQNQQTFGGQYNLTATFDGTTDPVEINITGTDWFTHNITINFGPGFTDLGYNPRRRSAIHFKYNCKINNTNEGYTAVLKEGTVEGVQLLGPQGIGATFNTNNTVNSITTTAQNIKIDEAYLHEFTAIRELRTAETYNFNIICTLKALFRSVRLPHDGTPTPTEQAQINDVETNNNNFIPLLPYYLVENVESTPNIQFNVITPSPANLDPPFRSTLASSVLYLPGHHVTYTVPVYDETDYYDDYSLIANPSAISAIHFSGTQGVFAAKAGEDEPSCATEDRLNSQIEINSGSNFSLEACHTTPAIRAAADLNDEIIYTTPVYIINKGHNRIAGQIPVAIHANDLLLTKPWTELNPNVTDHGHGTAGMGGTGSPIAKFVHGDSYPKQQFQTIYWKLNEGDDATAHASFSAGDCYADPAHEYPEENDISQQFDTYPTVYFCSPGTTNFSAHISDIDGRHHLLRRWTFNVGADADGNDQPENADVGETDILSAPGAIPIPTSTPPPSNIFQNIQVFPTPTPAPTKGPFLNLPALTPTPIPPPDVLPGNENYLRQQEFTNETPIIESVGAVERNDDDTYKVNVRFTAVEGADRYEIRITQPNAEGTTNIIQHLPVNNPEGTQFTFDTLYSKGRLKIEVRGVAECPAGNVGACVIQTLNDSTYRINPGESEYSPWSLPYGTAMDFLLSPPLINPDSVNTIENNQVGRYVNTDGNSLTGEVGGLAVNLLGLNTQATRNMGITIWAMICLGLATGIYIAAWKGSGTKSALSPVGGFLAVLSLIITWSVLGYIFWELKAGTAALPLAALLFIGIFKVWNTIKA